MAYRPVGLLLAALLWTGCEDHAWPACRLPVIAPADESPSALDLGVSLPCDEARAGRVGPAAEGALLGGPQARSRPGDYKLFNCKVAFTVDGERIGDDYVSFGGLLTDADLAIAGDASRPRRQRGRDGLRELLPLAEVSVPEPVRVSVVSDGRDGRDAVVRAEGPAASLPFFAWYLPVLPTLPLRFTIDYRLAPGAEALAIEVTARNLGAEAVAVPHGVAFQAMARMRPWAPGPGFVASHGGAFKLAGFVGEDLAYGLFAPEPLAVQLNLLGILAAYAPGAAPVVAPCGTTTWRAFLAVAPDAEGLVRARRATLGLPRGVELGGVVRQGGAPLAGARVHASTADGAAVSVATTDAAGAYVFAVDPGEYALSATPPPAGGAAGARRAGAGSTAVTVTEAGASQDLDLPAPARLEVRLDDGAGAAVAGKVQVAAQDALPAPRTALGESGLPYDLAAFAFTTDGLVALDLDPGRYRVHVSRGFAAAPFTAEVTVAAGALTSVTASLPAAVDTSGWLSLDSHLHADPSIDGQVSVEARLASIAGEGVDVGIETEHDVVLEYAPVVSALGLGGALATFGGVEVSAAPIGHFNFFPLHPRFDEPNYGAPRWWEGYNPPREFTALRLWNAGVVIQVNHPRSGSDGFFEHCGFDPATGLPTENLDVFTLDFDALEIANGKEDPALTLPDYAGLLNVGVPVAPVGTSDSHGLLQGEVGCSLTYLRTDATRATVNETALTHAIHGRRTVASRGLFVEARIGNASFGDLTGAVAAAAGLTLRVQGPPFANLTEVVILENGVAVHTRPTTPLDAVPGTAVLFEGVFPLAPTRDAWYVVVARGDADLGPVCPGGTPFAVTSPIFVDVDGDGVMTPPGPAGVP